MDMETGLCLCTSYRMGVLDKGSEAPGLYRIPRLTDYMIDSLELNPSLFSSENTLTAAGIFIAESKLLYLPVTGL